MTTNTFANYDITTRRNSGQEKVKCPKCSHERKNKRDTSLSVDHDEGLWNCHHCGWSGSLKRLNEHKPEKEYKIPNYNNTQLSDAALAYLKGRGIGKATIIHFGLTESIEKFGDERKKTINFNYYEGEKLINIKYRSREKDFKMAYGAKLIFYGLNNLEGKEEVVICEGEVDALSFYEVQKFAVVSVPNGASKGNQNLEYLDHCIDYFSDKKKIILATDSDEPGIKLRNELARRLGKERCFILQYPTGCKDANEVLTKYGATRLRECFDSLLEFPIENITRVQDVEDELDQIYNFGYPKGNTCGYPAFDYHISFRTGELTTISGIPNSGKSEFLDQIMVKLSKLHEWKFGVFSAENQPYYLHIIKLMEKYTEDNFYTGYTNRMSVQQVYDAKAYINDHFFFVNTTEKNLTVDGLLGKAKELVARKGIKGFLIDPYNYLEHKIPKGYTETQYISEFMSKLSRTAKLLDIHIFLIAHPRKLQKVKDKSGNLNYEVPTLYDIAGSSNFYNKTDNGFVVYRNFDNNTVSIHVQKIRFRFVGNLGTVHFDYDLRGGIYREIENQLNQ